MTREARDRTAASLVRLAASLSILTTVTLVVILVSESIAFLRLPSPLTLAPMIAGSLLVAGLALAFALPVALVIAVYLSEYCPPRVRFLLKTLLDVIAGVPSVVYGFVALSYVSPMLMTTTSEIGVYSALSGAIVLSAMIIPFMASLCDDAIQAVPMELRDAGRALGGTQIALVWHVILPNALAGVGAAAFLGIARALGETMIVLIACGLQPSLSFDPRVAVETLSAFIGAALLSDAGATEAGAAQLFFVATVLFIVTFVLNSISTRWRARYMRGSA